MSTLGPPLNGNAKCDIIVPERTRVLLLAMRQALIIALGAIEDYLGQERSIVPKHLRIR